MESGNERLSEIHQKQKPIYGYFTPAIEIKGSIMFLDSVLEDGLKGEFPIIYTIDKRGERLSVSTFEELITEATKFINEAECYAKEELEES
jgi:hypothetical protein